MADANLSRDIEDIIRRAQARPGISELMKVYGRYDEVIEQSREYLETRNTPGQLTVSTHTS